MPRTRLLCLVLATALAATSGSQLLAYEREETRLHLAAVKPGVTPRAGILDIEIEPRAYRTLWETGAATVEQFPLPDGQVVDLYLRPFRVLATDAEIINVNADQQEELLRPSIRFVRGTVNGEVDSMVVLGLFQNRITGMIRTRDQEFAVGPKDFAISGPRAMEMQVWNRNVEEGSWDCGVTHEASSHAESIIDFAALEQQLSSPAPQGGLAQLKIQVAVDSTTEWCAHFSDDATAAGNYLLAAIAQISAIYDVEVSEIFEVTFLRTFCGSVDPYTDGVGLADRDTLLDELEIEFNTNQTGVTRTVAHLFSLSDVSNSSGGVANTVTCPGGNCQAVLCTSSGYGTTLFPAQGGSPASFEISVAAHEFGHNHSSPHTNCLQDGGSQWLSTCNNTNTCGSNPWCQATGCYAGTLDQNITGTLMSTGCNARTQTFNDDIVDFILRSSAEAASCVEAAGLPGDAAGLTLTKVQSCPTESFVNDDNSLNFGNSGPVTWVKRYTPSCYPFELTDIDVIVPDFGATVGRDIRIMVYADPGGSGDPSNATLVYSEDTTVQTVSFSVFNEYTLATPVTISSGDMYIGFFDPVDDGSSMIPVDTSSSGDSYYNFGTDPSGFILDSTRTFMIRGAGGPVPAGSMIMNWNLPCNDATTPGQDYAVYRGDIGNFGTYSNLACTTNNETSYFAGPQADGFFLIVPHTTPSEGSYGQTSAGAERPASGICKTQDLQSCP